jgi:hypothetical protein
LSDLKEYQKGKLCGRMMTMAKNWKGWRKRGAIKEDTIDGGG